MTEQRIEEKIDFFNLPVAEEEIESSYAGYSVEYVVPVKDLADYPAVASEYAQQELSRRVEQGIAAMEEHIVKNGLADCSPVVYSKPDWENLGLAQYSIRIMRGDTDLNRMSLNGAVGGFARWLDSESDLLSALTMCTPGRNPLTGHGEE